MNEPLEMKIGFTDFVKDTVQAFAILIGGLIQLAG
jgi:hypothetical protein